MSSNKVKCSFGGCYLRFETVESMRKHKKQAEDEVHEWYCKKCDEDCEDDIAYLIHQIQSRKHIACPICGAEFKSEGGRDRHVGINHRRKQEIKCPGCKVMFESASTLMGHIEKDKCKTITRDDFHKHKAEQEIQRDVLEEVMGSAYQNSTVISSISSDPDSNGGISLLDNQRIHLERDWQGNPRSPPRFSKYENTSPQVDSFSQDFSGLAINKYPAMKATRTDALDYTKPAGQGNVPSSGVWNNSDLIDMQQEPEIRSSKPKTLIGDNNVWGNNRLVSSRPPATQEQYTKGPSSNLLDTASSLNLLNSTLTTDTAATRGTWRANTSNSNIISPSAPPQNMDPNDDFARIQFQVAKSPVTARMELHRYWDSIQSCYVCPGSKCGARIYSVQAFEQHLVSIAHVGERVQCPSCLKKFKTTTALVAHAESGSIKCDLRNSAEYDIAMRTMTAGLIKVDGTWRDGSVKYDSVPVGEW